MLATILLEYLGTPYIWGGNHPAHGLDCSGLVQIGLKSIGKLPMTRDYSSQMIYEMLTKSEGLMTVHQPLRDDVLFFGKDLHHITHISVAIDDRRMIEAGGGNSETRTVAAAIKRNAAVRIAPITSRRDIVSVIRLRDF